MWSGGGRPPWTQHLRIHCLPWWPGSQLPVILLTASWGLNCFAERWISHSQDRPAFPLRVLYCFQPSMATGFSALDEPTMIGMTNQDDDLSQEKLWCCSTVVRPRARSSGHMIFNTNPRLAKRWIVCVRCCREIDGYDQRDLVTHVVLRACPRPWSMFHQHIFLLLLFVIANFASINPPFTVSFFLL